ncbi:histidinol-phosphate transaminase [Clostridium tarantellae]|uniref:Histidinol-phosphate aminotransferase n=1 Tax=Clostridium tarantellae TaxID=39493 RepID=A0A6I1MJ17_9CLOT|nr:histidinol-phosphate transaminase [Clostridium tarantellae]MPQ42693.1 histidinol-phosphate transaminase [Clostridium tarantellae]
MVYGVREEILKIEKYVAGKSITEVKRELGLDNIVKMASNENPLGCSKKVKDALKALVKDTYLYPDSASYELKNLLGNKLNVKSKQIFCGAGSDSLIRVICNTLLDKDDESIVADITFPRYETNINLMGAKCIKIPVKNFIFNLEEMVNAITKKTKIIWFCNPNNPTGTIFTKYELKKVLDKIPKNVFVVIDEAYVEYVTDENYPDSLSLLKKYSNIIILRTFSKAYGLAALRIGYGIANEELVEYFNRVINSFDTNLYAQVAAIEAIKDEDFLSLVKQFNEEQRNFMYKEFDKLGLSYIKSQANFIMVKVNCDDKDLFNYLLKRGYIIRPGYLLGVPGYLRISIGKENENRQLVNLIKEYLKK